MNCKRFFTVQRTCVYVKYPEKRLTGTAFMNEIIPIKHPRRCTLKIALKK